MPYQPRFASSATAAPPPLSPLLWLLLFLGAALILSLGIWVPTALTGKDEFFLGMRTPMEMMARQEWLVPFLDGAPRIRKPPLLYWLARASYETFGISLFSARLVTVLFGALLVCACIALGRRLLADDRAAFCAGLVLLGCLGMATESRRLMLDIPVAATSAWAFWAFLVWQERLRLRWLLLAALLLGIGFLLKGPIVALVCGGGMLGLMAAQRFPWRALLQRWPGVLTALLLLAVVALPWFFLVRQLHPEAAALVYADEIEARQLARFSLDMLPGLLQIALPWSFIALALIWRMRRAAWQHAGTERLLLIWLLATCLPFLLVRTFDRYLVGSLVPLALLIAWQLRDSERLPIWSARLGMAIAVLFGALLAVFAWRFELGGWWLWLPAALYLSWAWGSGRARLHWLMAPIVYWIALLWGLFPALGINAVPSPVIELAHSGQAIAMYDGPQPALLPILSGRPLEHWPQGKAGQRAQALLAAARGVDGHVDVLVFARSTDLPALQRDLATAGLEAVPAGQYPVLASQGSGLRFARPGSTWEDWQAAWQTRDLSRLMTHVVWLRLAPLPGAVAPAPRPPATPRAPASTPEQQP